MKYIKTLFGKMASAIDLDALLSPWRLTKSEKRLIARLAEQDRDAEL